MKQGPGQRKAAGMLRSTVVFSAMTFLSRIAGYARDAIQASLFGAGPAVSAFVVAYRIPNYLRRIFAEGSFSSAFVPVLSELKQKGDEQAMRDVLDHVAGALLAAVVVVTALGMLLAPWIARLFLLFADDAETGVVSMAADMLLITFPYLVFISMTALAGGVLNTFRHFGVPALTPVLHNLAVIAAMLALPRFLDIPERALAWGVLAAGILQMAVLWPAMARLGIRPRFRFDFGHEGVRRVRKLMLPTIFSSSVAQVNLLVGTMFASLVVEAQSWLYYSDRLTELPLGLFGVAVGTVILPQLSRHFASQDSEGYSRSLDWGLRVVLLIGMPAALGLALLAVPLTAALFGRGEFTGEDTRMVGYALVAMSAGIPTFMLSKVLLPAFYARQDTRKPMRAAIFTVGANLVLTVALVTPLYYAGYRSIHVGIAAATAIAGALNAALLWVYLRREGIYRAGPGWTPWLLRIGAGLAAMSAAVVGLERWVVGTHGSWMELPELWRWVWLLLTIAAGAAAYGAVLVALGLRPRHLRH